MAEQLLPIKLPPGLANNGTVYQTKGRWHNGNLVRFFQGNIQPVGGWVQRTLSGDVIAGVPRAAYSWKLADGTTMLALGTTSAVYAIDASNVVTKILDFGGDQPGSTFTFDNFGYYLAFSWQITDGIGVSEWLVWDGNVAHAPAAPGDSFPGSLGNPTGSLALVVTPEQFLVLLGGADPNGVITPSGNPSIREVFFASQSTLNIWTADVTNTAGAFEIPTIGQLVAGKRGRGLTFLWTTTGLHTMTFIGGTLVYSFAEAGANCGLISSNAALVQDTMAVWMGQNGFFAFNGFVQQIPCEVQDHVFGDINRALVRHIFAVNNPAFGEATWYYASGAASENDSYVTFNYRENHWTFGKGLSRTAGVTQQEPGQVPVLFDASGNCYDHETGSVRTGGGTVFLESGPVEIGEGDRVYSVTRLIPDEASLGQVELYVYGQFRPLDTEVTYGPYTMANEPANVRVKARQMRLRFTELVASAWRIGVMRVAVIAGGRR